MQRLVINILVSFLFVFLLSFLFSTPSHANQNDDIYCDYSFVFDTRPASALCNSVINFVDVSTGGATGSQPYSDLTAVQQLSRMNLVFGYSQEQCAAIGLGYPCFRPNKNITRWEVAAIITRYHIYVLRDWYSWDPANTPNLTYCWNCVDPGTNIEGKYFADVRSDDSGYLEMHNALLHRWIVGSNCGTFYDPAGPGNPGMVVDTNHGNALIKSDDRCFGPEVEWIYGFHGVERGTAKYEYTDANQQYRGSSYCNYNNGHNDPLDEQFCQEFWHGVGYRFQSSTGTAPMTRLQFARDLYQYYLEEDNNNYCASPQTGTISGQQTSADGQGNYCVIHAGQSSCTTNILWSTTHTMNNACNKAYLYQDGNPAVVGRSGVVSGEATTGPSDVKSYSLSYDFEMKSSYFQSKTFSMPLTTFSFSGRRTTGSITFPGGACAIQSNATTCSQPVSWTTSYITDPNSLILLDDNNQEVVYGTSGSITRAISGPLTFYLFENGVRLTSQTVNPVKLRDITGTINIDYNDNAAIDVGDETFKEGTVVTLSNGRTTTTDSLGNYTFTNVANGTYTLSLPSTIASAAYPDGLGISSVQTNPITVTVNNANTTGNFFITPFYNITGGVFVDNNKNGKKGLGESYYTGSPITITSSNGGTISYPSSGTFKVGRLRYGAQTITYTSAIPSGYVITFPKVGSGSPSYVIQAGKPCTGTAVSPTGGDGNCNIAGNVYDINFGISNSTPWLQGVGFDMRFDGGFTNQVPSLTNSCGALYTMMPNTSAGSDATSQGGVYIGNSSAISAFGVRQTPSSKGWVIDSAYPETYKPVVPGTIRTSYTYLLSAAKRAGATQTDISTSPTCTDPSVSCSLPNLASGVYIHDGDVLLSTLTIPANRNVIILLKGNLSILGSITVPNTSTLTISVGDTTGGTAGNITIDKAIGSTPACPAPTGQIQGIFTADKTFTINGIGDCTVNKDTMLTIEGAVVVNASLTTGSFNNYRDLCEGNTSYPGVVIKERPDFIFHAPDLIKQQNYLFREIAP